MSSEWLNISIPKNFICFLTKAGWENPRVQHLWPENTTNHSQYYITWAGPAARYLIIYLFFIHFFNSKKNKILQLSIILNNEASVFESFFQILDIFFRNVNELKNNFSDDDFIGAGLGGMAYSCRLYKKTIPNCKFIKSWFQTRIKN
jgi:hypothetical protein